MTKFYIKATEALKSLRADQAGVVSFEYVIVAACIVASVAAAFGIDGNGAISGALTGAIGVIVGMLPAA
jgi:pilus assembly protein Flp/PilA